MSFWFYFFASPPAGWTLMTRRASGCVRSLWIHRVQVSPPWVNHTRHSHASLHSGSTYRILTLRWRSCHVWVKARRNDAARREPNGMRVTVIHTRWLHIKSPSVTFMCHSRSGLEMYFWMEWVSGWQDRKDMCEPIMYKDHLIVTPVNRRISHSLTLASLDVQERIVSSESGGKVIRNPSGRVYTIPTTTGERLRMSITKRLIHVLVSAHYDWAHTSSIT